MRTTLGELRLEIRMLLEFGVDDDNRNSAGFFMAGGISSNHRDKESSLMSPPPGLGGPAEREKEDEKADNAEKKSQPGARVYDRAGGAAGRSSRVGRKSRGGSPRNALPGENDRW